MSKPRLPRRMEEAWPSGLVVDPPLPIVDVSGAGGLVFAAGQLMFMLRPGAASWRQRDLPEDLKPITAVAAEPKPPWRYAVATDDCIRIFGLPSDQALTLRSLREEVRVTHMTWALHDDAWVLYLRWTDSNVGRVLIDNGMIQLLAVNPMDAIASDVNGVLAMVAVRCEGGEAHALVTRDGTRLEERPIDAPLVPTSPDARVHLAVADMAIAYSVEGLGTQVSRGVDDDFLPCEGLAAGGPLAFQGAAADAPLFGANSSRVLCAVDRVDSGGDARRLFEIEPGEVAPPRIVALQWDETRRTLWQASPQAGLMRSDEPRKAGDKRRVLN